jgi:hypothetical protein
VLPELKEIFEVDLLDAHGSEAARTRFHAWRKVIFETPKARKVIGKKLAEARERGGLGRTHHGRGASTTRQDQHERKTIMSDIKYADIRVQLPGTSGSDFMEEATGGGAADHLFQTVMRWVAVS